MKLQLYLRKLAANSDALIAFEVFRSPVSTPNQSFLVIVLINVSLIIDSVDAGSDFTHLGWLGKAPDCLGQSEISTLVLATCSSTTPIGTVPVL